MADKPKRRLKPPQSLREKAQAASVPKKEKKKHLVKTKSSVAWPFKKSFGYLGRFKTFRIIGKILLPTYFRNSWREIKLVTWPDRRTSIRLTLAVLAFAIVFGALVATLDFGLSNLFKVIILGKHH